MFPSPNSRNFPSNFLTTVFSRHLQRVHLYEPLYPLALSGVTRPLHQHLRPFTTSGPFTPSWGFFTPVSPVGGGLRQLWLFADSEVL